MKIKSCKSFLVPTFKISFVLLCLINSICGRRFAEEEYYQPIGYDDGQPSFPPAKYYDKAKTALEKLEQAPQWVNNWPNPSIKLGQVSGVAFDNEGRVLVFHRASNVWDANTFSERDVYNGIGDPPIPHPTIMVFNETGELVDMWGQNLFYMPHGITMDHEGNVWVTDVALHQVFKFTPEEKQKPAMILGEKFVPGRDDQHFCKPSAVAVLDNGDFFVADGYCNHRIMKFASDGTLILQWGKRVGESPFVLNVPHALTLAPERGLVCVADRERGRVACFHAYNGTFAGSFSNWLIGTRLFSVAYSPVNGGRLYVVNGPTISGVTPIRGYVIDFTSGRIIQTFAPPNGFSNPHDVIASPDGSRVYVAELNPYKVYKFVDDSVKNDTQDVKNETVHVKPTATVELSNSVVSSRMEGSKSVGAGEEAWGGWGGWRGAVGGAGSAAAAAALALAAIALIRARNRGKGHSYENEPFVQ